MTVQQTLAIQIYASTDAINDANIVNCYGSTCGAKITIPVSKMTPVLFFINKDY